jgi:Tetratricopeptide repeat
MKCLCVYVSLGAIVAIGPASAQSAIPGDTSNAALKLQERELFKRMLVRPNDLDVTFKYSEVAIRLGDLEAAIGALERILFYNPNLPRVRAELGVLYFRLGSYEQARSYFQSAVASQDTPAEVRTRVDGFLREIDRRASVNQFTFFAQTGLRHQTNANAGPGSSVVKALGQDAVLSSQFRKKGDWNWFAVSTARHVYDFENQRGDTWESNLTGYYSRQFKLTTLNLGLAELDTGPRLAIGEGTGVSIRPYALGNYISLDDRGYGRTGGGGVSLALPVASILLSPGVEYRARSFTNSQNYPNARDQRGNQLIGYVNASGPISFVNGLRWQAKAGTTLNSAREKYYSYNQATFDVSLPYEFEGPAFGRTRKWTISPYGGFTTARYKEPNPLVDPNIKRYDREWRVGTMIDAPIFENGGFSAQVQYSKTLSNIRNYRLNNFTVAFGPTVRF